MDILLNILVDIVVNITVLDNNSIKIPRGGKAEARRGRLKNPRLQASEVCEEAEVTEDQPEASQEMPPPISQSSS